MPIPTSITRKDLSEALKPLYELLGTGERNVFAIPSMTIGPDSVTFAVPVSHESVAPSERAPRIKASPEHPHPQLMEGTEFTARIFEMSYAISVEVSK